MYAPSARPSHSHVLSELLISALGSPVATYRTKPLELPEFCTIGTCFFVAEYDADEDGGVLAVFVGAVGADGGVGLGVVAFAPEAVIGGAGDEAEVGHRRDARQRLAPKPESAHMLEITRGLDLRGCMPLDGELHVLRCDAVPIVDDVDAHQTATLERHVDPRGARVDGVLEQLLHDVARPLDHLASGDFLGDRPRQRKWR